MCHPGVDPSKATDGILQDRRDQRELGEAQTCAVRSEVRGQDDVACGSASIARRVEVGHDPHVCESPFVARTTAQITHGTAAIGRIPYVESEPRADLGNLCRGRRRGGSRRASRAPCGRRRRSASGRLGGGAPLAASASERRRSSAWARVRPSLRWTTRSGKRRLRGALSQPLRAAALSKDAVSRLVGRLREDFESWAKRDLAEHGIRYLFLDGWYPRVRIVKKRVRVRLHA
jgi:mutator family transposase